VIRVGSCGGGDGQSSGSLFLAIFVKIQDGDEIVE
jgi:hypothetical protein